MKCKLLIGILVVLVCGIMLLSNVMASGWPPAWWNQATLSNIDSNPSQDPENSGAGALQVAVWEEWNGNDWDIHLKYNLFNGIPGFWVFPVVQPATTGADEINPAVTVTNVNPNGTTEIHVVYQRNNAVVPNSWDICHVWTNNLGVTWFGPNIIDAVVNNNARNPAIVYGEDQAFPGPSIGWVVHMVWSEVNPLTTFREIWHEGFYFDPGLVPVNGYIGPTLVRASPNGHCWLPEVAAVDERMNLPAYDTPFSVVWQEPNPAVPNMNVWYVAGITTTSPGPPATALVVGTLGQLNVPNNQGDSYNPDIAATQDYAPIGAIQTYYFHVVWVFHKWAWPPPFTFQIDSCYYAGVNPSPPSVAFIIAPPAQGPVNAFLDNPTVASKLLVNPPPTVFETWMAWEDSTNPAATNPDIWGRVGTYTVGAPPFIFTMAAPLRVPYVPGVGGNSVELNPELWNRNDVNGLQPVTHLVFDQSIAGAAREVIYIDP